MKPRFKGKSVLEIYEMIKNDPKALHSARRRLLPREICNTEGWHNVKEAVELYNKNCNPTIQRKKVPLQDLTLNELVDLITNDFTSLSSIRRMVTPSNKDKIPPEKFALYNEALRQRNILEKKRRKEFKLLKKSFNSTL